MAQTVTATSKSMSIINFSSGVFTGDGGITTVSLGFKPRMVKLYNVTGVITWEKFEGMAANTCIKTVTAGTTTSDTTGAITITDSGFSISAAASVNAQIIAWVAFA
jgi:hypothetical protein